MRNKVVPKIYLKGFVSGIALMLVIMITFEIGAVNIKQNIEVILNSININVEGTSKAKIGENYKLANGQSVPYSISYNGTTYLPLRKVAELVGKDIQWDGATFTANIIQAKSTTTTPTVTSNSRTNPALIGQKITFDKEDYLDGKSSLELTATSVIWGEEAWKLILDENMFNKPAPEGMQYMLVNFKIKVLKTEKDSAIRINSTLFEAVRKDGTVYSEFFSVVTPKELSTELYQGSETEGYIALLVKKDDQPTIRFAKSYQNYVWFNPNK